ncbi:hypothetical protein GCM10022255_071160 [Dactylosporangium darangshiense]|uniref:Uncharacterized protein n=1 Tax=Dactylosporangium darangshiense TaxID=579108 RepID=A0ABP8DJC9_9ACTN
MVGTDVGPPQPGEALGVAITGHTEYLTPQEPNMIKTVLHPVSDL